jgi:Ca-activated chloride channel homolog
MPLPSPVKAGMRVRDILDKLSGVTGGRAFYPGSEAETDEDFERIALELRHQYSVGYRPRGFVADGRWHRVKVKVTPPEAYPRLSVRGRQGYRAVAAPRDPAGTN